MADLPRVTVIIPHYNMPQRLPRAVKSVVDQQYDNIELIIADDGSDTPAADVLPGNDGDFILLSLPHRGKPAAVNAALDHADGDYITILDADDQLPLDSISRRVRAARDKSADLVIGSFEVSYNGNVQSKRSIKYFQSYSNEKIIRRLLTDIIAPFHQNAMLFSTALAKNVGPMAPEMLRSQDKDFAIRLLQESDATTIIDNTVYSYHRYDRPFLLRLSNRLVGMRYKLELIGRHKSGWQRLSYWGRNILIEVAKLLHDIFGVYKK